MPDPVPDNPRPAHPRWMRLMSRSAHDPACFTQSATGPVLKFNGVEIMGQHCYLIVVVPLSYDTSS